METSIFSLTAQVYALDKSQKWTPLTQDVITVSFLYSESANTTRIFAKDGDKVIVNSTILPNMQYRRPSETFVQWFDSQHILYGLNLTSVADAEGFEREFEIATGKRPRSTSKKQSNGGSANSLAGSKSTVGKTDGPNSTTTTSSVTTNLASMTLADSETQRNITSSQPNSAADAKLIASLKARIKELELQNLTADADRNSLNETIASQSKTISGLHNQIKQLEADIDKLKSAFQQNASNVTIWKQQLATYQEVNEQLSAKMTELAGLYDKFGEILKRE